MLVEALIKAIETAFAASADEIAIVAHEVHAAAPASIGYVGGCFWELLRSPASYDYNQGLWTTRRQTPDHGVKVSLNESNRRRA